VSEFDDLMGKSSGRKGSGRKKASALRWNPDDLNEKKRVTRDDDEWDEWLTAAQRKKALKDEKEEAEEPEEDSGVKKFAKDVAKDVLKDLKKPTRGNRRAKRRIAREVSDVVAEPKGKSLITKVAPLAMRLGVAAVAVGAAWWTVKTLEGRAVRKRVEAEIARTEANLKRPLTERELAALLPQYRSWFEKQMPTQKVITKAKSLFRRP